MDTKVHLATVDLLMTCNTLNNLASEAMTALKQDGVYPSDRAEQVDLIRAITLMRLTLNRLDPFVLEAIQQATKATRKPALYVV